MNSETVCVENLSHTLSKVYEKYPTSNSDGCLTLRIVMAKRNAPVRISIFCQCVRDTKSDMW